MYTNNKPSVYEYEGKIYVVFGECFCKDTKQMIKDIKGFYNFKNKFYNLTNKWAELMPTIIKDCYYQKIKL